MKRRDFVLGLIASNYIFQDILKNVSLGIISNAYASNSSNALKNYVCLWMEGGAEKTWFDAILTPNGSSDTLGQGAGVYNYITNVSNGVISWDYRTTNQKVNDKFYLPYLWESKLPTLNGGIVNMKDLANNLVVVRGTHTGLSFDAHRQNKIAVLKPFPNSSLAGAVADISNTNIPAILSDGADSFKSRTNKSFSSISPRDNAYSIFSKIQLESRGTLYSNSPINKLGHEQMDNIVSAFMTSLASRMPERKKETYEILMDNRRKAIELMKTGFSAMETDYNTAYNEYNSIISATVNPGSERILNGLDNFDLRGNTVSYKLSSSIDGHYSGFNVVDGFRNVIQENLVHALAKTEIFLKSEVSSSMIFNVAGFKNIQDQYSGSNGYELNFDMHFTGSAIRTIAFSRFFQSLSAGLLHLRQKLSVNDSQGQNIWNNTLIHLQTEFNRSKFLERGTDHNIYSCSDSFITGRMQDGPLVVGNVYDKYGTGSHCVGDGAPVEALNGAIPSVKHLYSTVANLMGFEGSDNHPSLLNISNTGISSTIGLPKNMINDN